MQQTREHADAGMAEGSHVSLDDPRGVDVGDALDIDFGTDAVTGWASVDARQTVGPLTSIGGERSRRMYAARP